MFIFLLTFFANFFSVGSPAPNVQQVMPVPVQSPIQTPQQVGVSTPLTSGTSSNLRSQNHNVLVIAEQRRLFNFGKRSSSSSSKSRQLKRKRAQTCTIKFVCLASKDAERPPQNIKERTDLSNACLGDKSIALIDNGEPIYDTIVENYPQLSEVGGFDFLLYQRGGGLDGGFHVVNGPHTAGRLKALCGQAKVYLRPVQRDIPLGLTAENVEENEQGHLGAHDSSQVFHFSIHLITIFLLHSSVYDMGIARGLSTSLLDGYL